jgi:hypothetical protein
MIIGNRLYRLNEPLKIWFEPRDIWVGVYWKHKDIRGEMFITDIYICVLPMLPLLISVVAWRKSVQQSVQRMGLLARISKWFGAIANR